MTEYEYYPDNLPLKHKDDPYKMIKTKDWKVGQCNEETVGTKTIKCSICGGTDFNVGSGSYFTAIRCVNCKYEICVHEG